MKDNELIAEFMGAKFSTKHQCWEFEKTAHTKHSMPYDTSWDWLMPVVEKIEYVGFHVLIEQNYCRIGEELDIRVWAVNQKIEAVYNAVVQFIKWYNSQKQ
jgi:hypothetical protein